MPEPTPPPTHDLREAVAQTMYDHDAMHLGPLWTWDQANSKERDEYHACADAILSGPIASELARLTRERDEARRKNSEVEAASCALLVAFTSWLNRALAAEAELATLKATAARDAEERVRLRRFVHHCEHEVYPLVRNYWALNRTQAGAFIDALNEARSVLTSPEKTDA